MQSNNVTLKFLKFELALHSAQHRSAPVDLVRIIESIFVSNAHQPERQLHAYYESTNTFRARGEFVSCFHSTSALNLFVLIDDSHFELSTIHA